MRVERATPDMFEGIYAVLQEFGSSRLRKQDWRRLLEYRFSDESYRGWVSFQGSEIVGFLGAIFSSRGGERFCNLTSWVVKKSHRNANLELLAPLLEMDDHTLTNLSPTPFTVKIFERLGFVPLEDRLLILPPVVPQTTEKPLRAITRSTDIVRVLDVDDARIYFDHLPYTCRHIAAEVPDGYCYVLASKTRFRRWPVTFIHYISNRELFCRLLNPIQRALMRANLTPFTVIDARLLAGQNITGTISRRMAQPRMYRPRRGSGVPPEAIDTLYSEFIVLDPTRWTFNY